MTYRESGIQFDNGATTVRGVMENGVGITKVVATIRNLEIRGIVRADEVTVERHRPRRSEAEITFEGSQFVNLTIDGRPVAVVAATRPSAYPVYTPYAAAFGQSETAGAPLASSLFEPIAGRPGNTLHFDGMGTIWFGERLRRCRSRRTRRCQPPQLRLKVARATAQRFGDSVHGSNS